VFARHRLSSLPLVAIVGVVAHAGLYLSAHAASASASATPPPPTVVLRVPGLTRSAWEQCDGVEGRRFYDRCVAEGRLLAADALDPALLEWLDGWSFALRERGPCVLWQDAVEPGTQLPSAEAASAEPERPPHRFGDETTGFALHADFGAPIDRLVVESRGWLPDEPRLRWEEAIEILELTRAENDAFRRLESVSGPSARLGRLRDAFTRDKGMSNLGIWILGAHRPAGVGWSLSLLFAFEDAESVLTAEALRSAETTAHESPPPRSSDGALAFADLGPEGRDLAERRFFASRVAASGGRVRGRVDRIFQSIAAIAPRGLLLVIDARESDDPFVALWSPDGKFDPRALGLAPAAR